MKYYFFSTISCLLKVNGESQGTLSLEPLEIEINKSHFLELVPQGEFLPITFSLNAPPNNVKVIETNFCTFVYPLSFKGYPLGYKKLLEKEFSNYKIEVLLDGVCKFLLQTNEFACVETISQAPTNIEILYKDNRYIALLFQLNKQVLIVKDVSSGETVFYKVAQKFYLENNAIYSTSTLPTICNHTITYCYSNSGTQRKIEKGKTAFSITNTTLFKFAFLECVSLKDNFSEFLKEDLPADKVSAFIGEFDYILPSPTPLYDFVLIGNDAKFIKLELENNLISNIETT